jgi:hypothetical protein
MPSHARKPRNYTREDFEGALEAVRAGMSIRKASHQFDVRRATLQDRLSNLHSVKRAGPVFSLLRRRKTSWKTSR